MLTTCCDCDCFFFLSTRTRTRKSTTLLEYFSLEDFTTTVVGDSDEPQTNSADGPSRVGKSWLLLVLLSLSLLSLLRIRNVPCDCDSLATEGGCSDNDVSKVSD